MDTADLTHAVIAAGLLVGLLANGTLHLDEPRREASLKRLKDLTDAVHQTLYPEKARGSF